MDPVDVMDGHFVPNLTVGGGGLLAEKQRTFSRRALDDNGPGKYARHLQSTGRIPSHSLQLPGHCANSSGKSVRSAKVGISIRPKTPLSHSQTCATGLVLIMTVEHGFGGKIHDGHDAQRVNCANIFPDGNWTAG